MDDRATVTEDPNAGIARLAQKVRDKMIAEHERKRFMFNLMTTTAYPMIARRAPRPGYANL